MRRLVLMLALATLALAAPGAAPRAQQSQDLRPFMDRLDRLERDMNLLQRQVYRGGSGSAPVPLNPTSDSGSSALNLEVRMGQLESQMRTLTGQVEETSYKVEQMRQRLEKLTGDIDYRLNQLEHGGGSGGGSSSGGARAGSRGDSSFAGSAQAAESSPSRSGPIQLRPPGAGANPAAPASQSGSLGTIETQGAGDGGADSQVASAPPNVTLPSGSAVDQYNYAFGLLRQSKYDEAEQALRAFVKRNPKDALAGNAQYWLGETYYVRKDYTNAAATFAEGYEKYPKSGKAPDDLLKLGMSLGNLGQKDNACRAFARLDRDFPQAAPEVKDRAGAEKRRLGCAG